MRAKLKRGILLVLGAWERPMPEGSLVSAVQSHARPSQPTESDVVDALKECESEGFVTGVTDDFTKERSWSLTTQGEHKARQLR